MAASEAQDWMARLEQAKADAFVAANRPSGIQVEENVFITRKPADGQEANSYTASTIEEQESWETLAESMQNLAEAKFGDNETIVTVRDVAGKTTGQANSKLRSHGHPDAIFERLIDIQSFIDHYVRPSQTEWIVKFLALEKKSHWAKRTGEQQRKH